VCRRCAAWFLPPWVHERALSGSRASAHPAVRGYTWPPRRAAARGAGSTPCKSCSKPPSSRARARRPPSSTPRPTTLAAGHQLRAAGRPQGTRPCPRSRTGRTARPPLGRPSRRAVPRRAPSSVGSYLGRCAWVHSVLSTPQWGGLPGGPHQAAAARCGHHDHAASSRAVARARLQITVSTVRLDSD
jgi:hypothetical protein